MTHDDSPTGLRHDRRHAFFRVWSKLLYAANWGKLPTLRLQRIAEKELPLIGAVPYRVDGGLLDGTMVTLTWDDREYTGPNGWPYNVDEANPDEGEPEEVLFVVLNKPNKLSVRAVGGLTPFSVSYQALRGIETIEALVDMEGDGVR